MARPITEGQFQAQINEIEPLLSDYELLMERNKFPDYSSCGISQFRGRTYKDIWEICYGEQWYDFLLTDHALFQFRVDLSCPCLNYVYYDSPYDVPTYEDFLVEDCGFAPEELPDIGDSGRNDYETSLITSGLKAAFTPLRYDYDPARYVAGRHPASHLHIGRANNIRIGTKKLLKPLSFVLFVLRQQYPDIWMCLLNSEEDNSPVLRNVRTNLEDIDGEFHNDIDDLEMILI
jgi:hypothetical protein